MRGPLQPAVPARRRGRRVAEVIATGWVSQGPRVREFEARLRRARRRRRRRRRLELHDRAAARAARRGRRARRRGDRAVDVVHRHGQLGLAVRRDAGLRRRRPADVQPRPGRRRARDHAAHQGDHAGPPARPAGRHGRRSSRSPTATGSQLVEDAACAIGARYKGRTIGSIGPLACFSLHPRKVITTGEGGMITLQRPGGRRAPAPAAPARDGRLRPRPPRRERRGHRDLSRARLELPHDRHAGDARPVPARAARRDPRRARRGWRRATRRRSSRSRSSRRRSSPGYAERTWQSYAVTLAPDAPVDRNELMRRLLLDGVPTRRGVMAIHREASYAGAAAALPHTERGVGQLADAAAVRRPDRRAAGPRHRLPRSATWRPSRYELAGRGRPRAPDRAPAAQRGCRRDRGAPGQARLGAGGAARPGHAAGVDRRPARARARSPLPAGRCPSRCRPRPASRSPSRGSSSRRGRAPAATPRCFRMVAALERAGHTCILYLQDRHGWDIEQHARDDPGVVAVGAGRGSRCRRRHRGRPRDLRDVVGDRLSRPRARPRAAAASTWSRTSSRRSTRPAAPRCWRSRPTASASTA